MSGTSGQPFPLVRLALYLVIFSICGVVAGYELYYFLGSDTTTATILSVGRSRGSLRSASYWADYEYFDGDQIRHVGKANNVHPTTRPGDQVEIQYLWQAPDNSRFKPSWAGGLCYGMVALLAVVVLVAEVATRWPKKRSSKGHKKVDID